MIVDALLTTSMSARIGNVDALVSQRNHSAATESICSDPLVEFILINAYVPILNCQKSSSDRSVL